jgi:CelD/BcsL family acetyltransferase involved in cellulose biosynthesis
MKLSITSDLTAIEEEWRCFEQRAECTPFQTFEWLSAWQRCIGGPAGVKPAIVTGRQGNGELLFLLPLAVERTRFSRRCVFLGHALCDYNAPLLAPEFACAVAPAEFAEWWRAVEGFIRNTPGYDYDLVAFDKMPERVGRQPNPLLALATTVNPSTAYRARLGKDWPSYYAEKRSSATRQRDRSKRRKLAQGGEVRLRAASDPDERQAALRILFHQKGRVFASTGVANLFTRPGHSDFYLFVAATADSLVHVTRLDVGSTCVAANLGLRFRETYYHILTSYDDGPLKRFGPGIIHLHELMRYAIAEGFTHFDFTIGDESYKLEWADEEVALHDHVAVAGWLGLPAAALISLNPRVKRFFKENSPSLWRLAVRGKAIVGSFKSPKRARSSP